MWDVFTYSCKEMIRAGPDNPPVRAQDPHRAWKLECAHYIISGPIPLAVKSGWYRGAGGPCTDTL